jgi:nucleoside-triphosphatase
LAKRILLLTGAPGVGKTTVLTKTVEALKADGVTVGGMISCETRQRDMRVGFEVVDLISGKHGWLAHVNGRGPSVGKYHVKLPDLENIGVKAIVQATEQCQVVTVDEIGPMELYSKQFKQAVTQALESEKAMLAVIHAKAKDALITAAKQRADAEVFLVTVANRESLPFELEKAILGELAV